MFVFFNDWTPLFLLSHSGDYSLKHGYSLIQREAFLCANILPVTAAYWSYAKEHPGINSTLTPDTYNKLSFHKP